LHDAALEDARRTGGSSFVAARKAALGAEYLPLAPPSPRSLARRAHRLAALPRGAARLPVRADLERSLREAREAAREEPAFYEAHALAARVLEEQGQAAADRGDAAAADAAFLEAIAELGDRCPLRPQRRGAVRRAGRDLGAGVSIWGNTSPTLGCGSRSSRERSSHSRSPLLAAAPRRTGAYGRRAHTLLPRTDRPGPATTPCWPRWFERCTQAARTALELDPTDVFALQMRGDCTMDRALALDPPLPALAGSVADFTEVLRLAPGSPWAANDLCLALTSFAELTWIAGRDAVPTAERAIANCLLATRIDPAYANPWLNITFTYGVLAGGGLGGRAVGRRLGGQGARSGCAGRTACIPRGPWCHG
jgi:hypothetical protein